MIQFDSNNLVIFDGPHYIMNKKLLSPFDLWPTLGRKRKVTYNIYIVCTNGNYVFENRFIFNLTHPIEKMMAIVICMGKNTLLFYMS
ncbi:hypothetical protein TSAR_014248 [Trichomalopsis sarcophagae]|uniref:Uncharacterized protein n=1 Tax=Trichomalopsis sarcophagae TaxID=543379 RepID=A0A232FK33_9HYME|nr:hypothetical protein TSAR_014248 [Trichomalopsis sarcophagae]